MPLVGPVTASATETGSFGPLLSAGLVLRPVASASVPHETGSLVFDKTDNILRVYSGTKWDQVPHAGATGGGIEYDGGYTYHVFKESGNFQVYNNTLTCDILMVGAGGGAGGHEGGGGGGGNVLHIQNRVISSSTHAITVGAGGAGGQYDPRAPDWNQGSDGGHTLGFGERVYGGGGGGYISQGGSGWTFAGSGLPGSEDKRRHDAAVGNGGGAGDHNSGTGVPGGTGSAGTCAADGTQYGGFGGGAGMDNTGTEGCGGGGGATAAAGPAGAVNAGTDGGAGKQIDFGIHNYYWGGGGGGSSNGNAGHGGIGGGGGAVGAGSEPGGGTAINDGHASMAYDGGPGGANSGGGGGGGHNGETGGCGGSGIVIVRYIT